MKKVLLVAAATVALSTSVMADDNMFYLRGDLGMNKFQGFTDKVDSVKLKTKWDSGVDLGVGYYVMDNVRAELVWAHPFNVEAKKSYTNNGIYSGSVKHKATIDALLVKAYVDVADLGMAKLFVGGGFGLSMIKEKATDNYSYPAYSGFTTAQAAMQNPPAVAGAGSYAAGTGSGGASSKKSNTLAWTLGLGAGFDVADGVKVDAQYAYTDFGKTKSALDKNGSYEYGKNRYRAHAVKVGVRFDI